MSEAPAPNKVVSCRWSKVASANCR